MIYWEVLLGSEDVKGTLDRLYKEFSGAAPLAAHLGISIISLRKKLHECGIQMLPRGGPHFRTQRAYFPDKWWNLSTEQLVRITGYSSHYVRRLRREKLCQLGQAIKMASPDSSSNTLPENSVSTEPEKE